MGKRHEVMRRCAQVRDLVQEGRFVQALELIDTLTLTEVESLEDLYLFADLYEKAERLNEKKDIFFLIYERTHSRYILNRLLRLVIRMGNMDEARELFLTYEFAGKVTLDTFELRYLLAKAQGESRTTLISILEELKKEEYTEEWGYQLALLYEMEGMREECIQECKDLKLWFGEGRIIDKAMELKKRCEAPDWEPPGEAEIPEPEEPDREPRLAYAVPRADVTELDLNPDQESVSAPYKKEMKKELKPEKQEQEREREPEPEPVDAVPEEEKDVPPEEGGPGEYTGDFVSAPRVVKREKPVEQREQALPLQSDAEWEDDPEDISERGVSYRTLKSTIAHMRRDDDEAHFVFAGGEERIVLAVAKRITKELHRRGQQPMRKIAKIAAEKLNGLELSEQREKLAGTCMLVTEASEITEKTAGDLLAMIEDNGSDIVVMLSGPFDELDCFLSIYKDLSDKLIYKIHM